MRHRPVNSAAGIAGTSILFTAIATFAATPPELLNYQGVLRNSSDQPLSGNYAVVFRLTDASTGNEILVDSHDAAGTGSVTVANGLLNVQIGSGWVTDGAGPGVYTSLSEVFRDHDDVLLRVEVNGEILSPDVRGVSSAYAHNASHFAGLRPDQYLRSDMDNLALGKNSVHERFRRNGPGRQRAMNRTDQRRTTLLLVLGPLDMWRGQTVLWLAESHR